MGRSDRSVRTRRPVGTVPCVAGSSARHWQDYQANQRVIGMSIEISSRLAVICRVSNAEKEGMALRAVVRGTTALPDVLRQPQAIFQFSLRALGPLRPLR